MPLKLTKLLKLRDLALKKKYICVSACSIIIFLEIKNVFEIEN